MSADNAGNAAEYLNLKVKSQVSSFVCEAIALIRRKEKKYSSRSSAQHNSGS
jgi:hypothetical protein